MNNKPSVQGVMTVTAATATIKIGRRNLILTNSGSKTVFIRFNGPDAVVTDFPLLTLKSFQFNCNEGDGVYSVSAICGGADNSTLDYIAWN